MRFQYTLRESFKGGAVRIVMFGVCLPSKTFAVCGILIKWIFRGQFISLYPPIFQLIVETFLGSRYLINNSNLWNQCTFTSLSQIMIKFGKARKIEILEKRHPVVQSLRLPFGINNWVNCVFYFKLSIVCVCSYLIKHCICITIKYFVFTIDILFIVR